MVLTMISRKTLRTPFIGLGLLLVNFSLFSVMENEHLLSFGYPQFPVCSLVILNVLPSIPVNSLTH